MSINKELTYVRTAHTIDAKFGMEDVVFARSLLNGNEYRQEQLIRVVTAVVEMDSGHIEHPNMRHGVSNKLNDLYQDVFETQGLILDKNLTHSKVGRKSIAVANLFSGSYDQDGFELMMVEPFENASVLDLLNGNLAQLNTPEFFTTRVRAR